MKRQNPACLGLVLAIFSFFSTVVLAQQPAETPSVRDPHPQGVRPQREPLAEGGTPYQMQFAQTVSTEPEQSLIPLGTYAFVSQRDNVFGNFTLFSGEYFLTLQAGGKYQLGRNDWISQAGTYTVTATTIELVSPFGNDTCSIKGTYLYQSQGNRLAFSPANPRATDGCLERFLVLTSGPLTRTDNSSKEWKNIGPSGGRILALHAAEGKVFAGTDGGGMFVSSDNGQTWKSTKGTRAYSVFSFGSFNGMLFAGGQPAQAPIYVSMDGGDTWEFALTNLGGVVYDFVESNGKFYAATLGNGVWRMGANPYLWEKVGTLPNQNVYSLATLGNHLFAATDGAGVFRSSDGGTTWMAVNTGITQPRIRTLAVERATLYAGSAFGTPTGAPNEVFSTEDNGQNWTRVGNGLTADFPAGFTNSVYELVPSGGKLFATGSSGVLMYDGKNWNVVYNGAGQSPIVSHFTLAASGNVLLAGAWFDGVARSTDGGITWAKSNTGLTGRWTNTIHKESGVLLAGVRDGVLISNNEGQTWTRGAMTNAPNVICFHSFGGKVYAGAGSATLTNGAGIWVSSDQGATWTRSGTGLPANVTVYRIINVGATLYAALLGGGVYRSTDNGASWAATNNGLPSLNVWDISAVGNNLFVGLSSLGIYRSSDGGQNWIAANQGLPAPATVLNLVSVGNTILAGISGINSIYRSEDSGQTWQRVLGDLTLSTSTLYSYNGIAYAGPDGGYGVLRSFDEGRTWQIYSAGLDARFVLSQGFHGSGNSLYVATFNGVYVSNNVHRASVVSAASFSATAIVEKGIAAAFGTALATSTQSATTTTLPTMLSGTSVRVTDANGVERVAPLFFVSSGQVNFQVPAGTAVGTARVTITNESGTGALGTMEVKAAAPALFTMTGSGTGAAIAVDAITGAVGPFSATQANGQPNIIAVFGTGLGAAGTDVDGNLNTSTTARIGSAAATVQYAGRAPGFTGLNQFNIVLPGGLSAGTYPLTIVRGLASNTVTITIK